MIGVAKKRKGIVIACAGDMMLGRLVSEVMRTRGCAYIWGNIKPLLAQSDVRVANLENTFTAHNQPVPKVFNFRALPDQVNCLNHIGIDVVNLANNHILDFGIEGLRDTITALDKAGIAHVGAGMHVADAQRPVILEKNGIRIGILGYTDNEPTWAAGPDKPGIAFMTVQNYDHVIEHIKTVRRLVDVLIVNLHWGPNMRLRPTEEYRACAHALVDAGADIIQGHSSHVFQGIELYNKKIIMYDVGDLIDDYAVDTQLRNDWSILVMLEIVKNNGISQIIGGQVYPLIMHGMQVHQAVGQTGQDILRRLRMLSAEFSTHIDEQGRLAHF